MKKKILRMIGTVFLALIVSLTVGLNIYSYNAKMVAHDPLPMPFGVGLSVVLSGSMEPELSVGDLIIVKEAEDYGLRDVVVYQSGNSAVVHRIIRIEGDMVIAKGDANSGEDEPVEKSRIKGKVVLAIPALGDVVSFLKSPIGILLVLGLASFLFYLSFQREKEEQQEKLRYIREEIEKLKEENKIQ